MLDIKFIQANQEIVKKAVKDKGLNVDLGKLLDLHDLRNILISEIDFLRNKRKSLNNEFTNKKPSEEIIIKSRNLKNQLIDKESNLKKLEDDYQELMLQIPNIPWSGAPIGNDETFNKVIKKVGQPSKFSFTPKNHIDLGLSLDLIDLERGAKTSGFHGYYLKNEAVLMHYGLMLLGLNSMVKAGFTLMIPPTIVKYFSLLGSGHFPFGNDEIFEINNPNSQEKDQKKYLTGTSEPSLLAYYADQSIDEKKLPIKLCGIGNCYREEIGSYGKYTKGLYRLREFMKVEQLVICQPDQSEADKWFNAMLEISENILQDLDLPYQLVETCTGDMGAGKRRMVDIETWMPSREGYGETHSNSDLTDWQAKRLNIKVKQTKKYVFTLNNTVIASPRILISILENNQNKDGSITIPKALHPFVGKKKITTKK
ncbi:MAG: serine--tRNA ligase [bacterium]